MRPRATDQFLYADPADVRIAFRRAQIRFEEMPWWRRLWWGVGMTTFR